MLHRANFRWWSLTIGYVSQARGVAGFDTVYISYLRMLKLSVLCTDAACMQCLLSSQRSCQVRTILSRRLCATRR